MDFQGGERGSKGGKKVGWLKGESGSNNLECFMFFSSCFSLVSFSILLFITIISFASFCLFSVADFSSSLFFVELKSEL